MFTYKLSYIDISYQNRKIITLIRVNEMTKMIEFIRASFIKDKYSEKYDKKYLNSYTSKNTAILNNSYVKHCMWPEESFGAKEVDETRIECLELWNKIMGLIQQHSRPYPIICETTFIGDIVNTGGGLNGSCNNLEITKVRPEQELLINSIFDTAIAILDQSEVDILPLKEYWINRN